MNKKPWHIVMLLAVDLAILILVSSLIGANAMHLGESGERILTVQKQLAEKGFFEGETVGIFCPGTRSSIKKFQTAVGIASSGKTDYETLCALGISSAAGEGFTSEALLLARCIELEKGVTHYEMISEGLNFLKAAHGIGTLSDYALKKHPDIINMKNEPSCDAFSAAVQAMRIFSEQTDSLF